MTITAPRTTPSGTQAGPSGEIRTLTGLRIVAAVWVVAFHFHFTSLGGVTDVVGVLGPLEVRRDGALLDLGAGGPPRVGVRGDRAAPAVGSAWDRLVAPDLR